MKEEQKKVIQKEMDGLEHLGIIQNGLIGYSSPVLQHLTPNYIKHSYSQWADNLYVHKTKDYDMTQLKTKCGRPPKKKTKLDITQTPAANTHTI